MPNLFVREYTPSVSSYAIDAIDAIEKRSSKTIQLGKHLNSQKIKRTLKIRQNSSRESNFSNTASLAGIRLVLPGSSIVHC